MTDDLTQPLGLNVVEDSASGGVSVTSRPFIPLNAVQYVRLGQWIVFDRGNEEPLCILKREFDGLFPTRAKP